MAVCPFHSEKTPSLSIDPARGLYHCFGCGKSGDVFRWVQETQTLDFNDSVEFLARRAGITLTPDPGSAKRHDRRERLVDAVERATAFYHDRLKSGADAGQARGYLRQRGYDADVVEQFVLGFSPPDWDLLVRHLRDAGISDEAMVGAGLASRSSRGSLVDRFRGRLMFPIYDVRGDTVGFGARILDGDGPKYLNSPETPIYHKSRLLYGLNWSKSQIVRADEAVVVEGYTDVIAFHLADMSVAVATCGTALGEEHLDLLRRFSQRVVLAFDADEAGAGAAIRGFDRSVPGDLDLRVALLPEGRDPADLVSAGDTGKLEAAIADSLPLLQFRIENELDRFDLAEPEARGRAVQAAAQLISLYPDPVVRHEYAVLVSRRTGVEVAQIEGANRPGQSGRISAAEPIAERPTTGGGRAEWELLRLLLVNDPGARRHDIGADLFSEPRHREAYELFGPAVAALPPGEIPDLGAILGDDDSAAAALVRRLALQEDPPLSDADEVMIKLRLVAVEQRIADLGVEQRSLGAGVEDQDRSDELTYLISSLEQERRNLRSRE
jgi:DNA primase